MSPVVVSIPVAVMLSVPFWLSRSRFTVQSLLFIVSQPVQFTVELSG